MKTIMTIQSYRVATRRLRLKIYAFACRGVYMTVERDVMGVKKVIYFNVF